jgi:RNA polymerase sigma factor (sigma-70 family)
MSSMHHNRAYVRALDEERASRTRAYDPDELGQLVRDAASGEQTAWSTLVRRFRHRISRQARAHRLAVHDVEEVVQATFIHLFTHLGSIRDPGALPVWLDTTAHRESLRVIRASRRDRPIDDEVIACVVADEDACAPLDDHCRAELERALDALPERQRSLVLALHAEDEPSYEMVSRELDMPVGSIGPTRARALKRLRRDSRLAAAAALELGW